MALWGHRSRQPVAGDVVAQHPVTGADRRGKIDHRIHESDRLTTVERPTIPGITREEVVAHDEGNGPDSAENGEAKADHRHLRLQRTIDFDDQQVFPWLSEPFRTHQDRGRGAHDDEAH